MRSLLPTALSLLLLAGCSEVPEVPAPQAASRSESRPGPAPAAETPAPPPSAAYPESSEVQAILYRARELRDAGKFREALAAAGEALARDPNSPAANALHRELSAVVIRI